MNIIKGKIILMLLFLAASTFAAGSYYYFTPSAGSDPGADENVDLALPELGIHPAGSVYLPQTRGKTLNLLFFGDLMLDRHVGERIARNGLDSLLAGWASTSEDLWNDNDLVSANLEGAVTDNGAHYKPDMSYDFAFKPELIRALRKYNFNFFNIANNHLADQGENGIIETRNNLSALGFDYSGCKDGEAGECSTKKLEVRSQKIGMAGFSMVYKITDRSEMMEIVSDLASTTDLVVVNMHWGTEYVHEFSRVQQELAHALVDAGADIIIGHHPHVVQGMELYKSKPIFYSLGNFIFDQYFSADTQEELAVKINWQKDEMTIEMLPMRSESSRPRLMMGEEKSKFLSKFVGWSKVDRGISEQIKDGRLSL